MNYFEKNFYEVYEFFNIVERYEDKLLKIYNNIELCCFINYEISLLSLKCHNVVNIENRVLKNLIEKKYIENLKFFLIKDVDPFLMYLNNHILVKKKLFENVNQIRTILTLNYGKFISGVIAFSFAYKYKDLINFYGLPDLKCIHFILRCNNLHNNKTLKEYVDKKIYAYVKKYLY